MARYKTYAIVLFVLVAATLAHADKLSDAMDDVTRRYEESMAKMVTKTPPVELPSPKGAEQQVKERLLSVLKDPESVRWGDIHYFESSTNAGAIDVCGELNAKNSYGGYAGMSPFYVALDHAGPNAILGDPDISSLGERGYFFTRNPCCNPRSWAQAAGASR